MDGGNASGVGVGNNGVVDGDVGGGGESGGGVSGGGEDGGGWGEDKSSSNCSGLSSSGSLTDVSEMLVVLLTELALSMLAIARLCS